MPGHTGLLTPNTGRLALVQAPRRAVPEHSPEQLSFEALGTPLSDVTFVVVDLETTGQAPAGAAITEVGAVKVRGGQVLGEFQTLVNPGVPIPPMITVLTGITTAMVIKAPRIAEVLPSFLEFAGFAPGTVLVAHNARFDVAFLKAASRELGHRWPAPQVVDTLALARKAFTRDDVPNHRLGTLARAVGSPVTPDHRALTDARATVDVLHSLLERLAPLGLTHLEDLRTVADPVPPKRRRKAHLSEGVPNGPGVYQFIGPGEEVLYVGTATDLRSRVRSYFTAAEKRRRIGEMVDLSVAVRTIPCASVLEARVRELRLIKDLDPQYNRRSRAPSSRPWLRLTAEPYPRLSVVRSLPLAELDAAWGPFSSHQQAIAALEAVQSALGVRTCTTRLPASPAAGARSCLARELGTCGAPCVAAEPGYDAVVDRTRAALGGMVDDVVAHLAARIAELSRVERYEEALTVRERLRAALAGSSRSERLRALVRCPELVAARPTERQWELVMVRHGRFAGAANLAFGERPGPTLELLRATAEHVPPPSLVGADTSTAETELLVEWCFGPAVRLVEFDPAGGPMALPLRGGSRWTPPPTG